MPYNIPSVQSTNPPDRTINPPSNIPSVQSTNPPDRTINPPSNTLNNPNNTINVKPATPNPTPAPRPLIPYTTWRSTNTKDPITDISSYVLMTPSVWLGSRIMFVYSQNTLDTQGTQGAIDTTDTQDTKKYTIYLLFSTKDFLRRGDSLKIRIGSNTHRTLKCAYILPDNIKSGLYNDCVVTDYSAIKSILKEIIASNENEILCRIITNFSASLDGGLKYYASALLDRLNQDEQAGRIRTDGIIN